MPCVGLDALTVLQQMDRGPVAAEIELLPLPQRDSFRILDVGDHFCCFGRNQGVEFGANDIGRRFECAHRRCADSDDALPTRARFVEHVGCRRVDLITLRRNLMRT